MKQAILCVILLAATTCWTEVEYDQYGSSRSVRGEAKGHFLLQMLGERW